MRAFTLTALSALLLPAALLAGEPSPGDTCTPGDVRPAEDGCNTCACDDSGAWACTEDACVLCPIALDEPDPAQHCEEVPVWLRMDDGTCCPYATACTAPPGEHHRSLEACETSDR